MNLLIVDDQITVTESLKEGLSGRTPGIDEIYTANSAEVARLVMKSFPIDILLADIEMPEENGLSLVRWALNEFPELTGIFLTSHAEFAYAKEAIRIGCFDYILQPARMEEIRSVLERAVHEVQRKKRASDHAVNRLRLYDQRETMLELLLIKARENNTAECERLYKKLRDLCSTESENCVFRTAMVKIVHMERQKNTWDQDLINMVFHNILDELLNDIKATVITAREDLGIYRLAAAADSSLFSESIWKKAIEECGSFVNSYMDFRVAVFADMTINRIYDAVLPDIRTGKTPGVYWADQKPDEDDKAGDNMAERMERAKAYIKENIGRGLTRTEVAEYLHINEDHFTRCFKKYTGYTFKEYDILVRMEAAKRLLEQTRLPVSMIAGKVGFDNFSHFSQAFKKYYGKTPSEYR